MTVVNSFVASASAGNDFIVENKMEIHHVPKLSRHLVEGSRVSFSQILFNDQTNNLPNHSFQQMLPPRRQSLPICMWLNPNPYHQPPQSTGHITKLHRPLGPPKHPPRSPWVKTHWIFGEAEVDAAGGKKNKYTVPSLELTFCT